MGRIKGTLKLSSNMEILAGAPLDARSIVPLKTDLTGENTFPYSYIGMTVVTQDEGKLYILKAKPTTVAENWAECGSSEALDNYYTKTEVDNLIAAIYKPAGSATLETLPELSADVLGNVYNMTEAFTTTADFVEGAGKTYPIGTNVVVVDLGDAETHDYKFDVMPGFVDLSGYQYKMQMETLPTASEDLEGTIYQYVGTTTADYTNGFFYQCIEDPETPDTYIWVQKNLQDAGSNGELLDSLTCTKAAGGIEVGDTYVAGTSYETLWRDLLSPTMYPSLTGPSATATVEGSKILEVGDTKTATLTTNFNRGSISPAYGTSGYRSGAALTYALNGGTPQEENTFTINIDADHTSFEVEVAYAAGEQPKDSTGADYDTPLAAGSVTTPAVEYEYVNAIWANISSITEIAKQPLVSKSAKLKQFDFPAATVANPEVFDVPASWSISAVEVLNTLSNLWETCADEFTITDTVHDDAAGTSTNYKRYTCNLGYSMGARKIRIKWA